MYGSERAAERVRALLSELLYTNVIKDPRLEGIFWTKVDVSSDKSFVKIYYSITAKKDDKYYAIKKNAEKGLNKAKGFIRSTLGKALGWRVSPELIFIYDDSLDRTEKIEKILKDIAHKNA